jgi:hypothetical protein
MQHNSEFSNVRLAGGLMLVAEGTAQAGHFLKEVTFTLQPHLQSSCSSIWKDLVLLYTLLDNTFSSIA